MRGDSTMCDWETTHGIIMATVSQHCVPGEINVKKIVCCQCFVHLGRDMFCITVLRVISTSSISKIHCDEGEDCHHIQDMEQQQN